MYSNQLFREQPVMCDDDNLAACDAANFFPNLVTPSVPMRAEIPSEERVHQNLTVLAPSSRCQRLSAPTPKQTNSFEQHIWGEFYEDVELTGNMGHEFLINQNSALQTYDTEQGSYENTNPSTIVYQGNPNPMVQNDYFVGPQAPTTSSRVLTQNNMDYTEQYHQPTSYGRSNSMDYSQQYPPAASSQNWNGNVVQQISPIGIMLNSPMPNVEHVGEPEKPAKKTKKRYPPKNVEKPRRVNFKDTSDPLNSDDIDYNIPTVKLVETIKEQLSTLNISQTLLAARLLGRSQGTLSELLKNPKPWNELKVGFGTYRRLYHWAHLPIPEKMAVLYSEETPEEKEEPEVPKKQRSKRKNVEDSGEPPVKKTRFVFSPYQRATLNDLWKTHRFLSPQMQEDVARRLNLAPKTVQNFFMNARRRCRGQMGQEQQPELQYALDDVEEYEEY